MRKGWSCGPTPQIWGVGRWRVLLNSGRLSQACGGVCAAAVGRGRALVWRRTWAQQPSTQFFAVTAASVAWAVA